MFTNGSRTYLLGSPDRCGRHPRIDEAQYLHLSLGQAGPLPRSRDLFRGGLPNGDGGVQRAELQLQAERGANRFLLKSLRARLIAKALPPFTALPSSPPSSRSGQMSWNCIPCGRNSTS